MDNNEGWPKTSRDFFRDLEKAASIEPNTSEEEYLAKKRAEANKDKIENSKNSDTRSSIKTGNASAQSSSSTASSANSREHKSFYRGSGNSHDKKSAKASAKNLINRFNIKDPRTWAKASPLAAIIGVLAFAFFAIFGSGSLLGAHLEALYTEATDTQYASNVLRSNRLMSYMLDGGDQIKTTWNGSRKYKSFSPWLKSRFEKNGIKIGTVNSEGQFVESKSLSLGKKVLQYNDEIIDADNFSKVFRENAEFREAYTYSKRGRVAGFFDEAANRIYEKLGLSRDIFEKFRQTGDNDTDTANYKKTMSAQFDGDTSAHIKTSEDRPVYDEEGKPVKDKDGNQVYERVENTDTGSPSDIEGDTPTVKAQNYLSKAASAASTACGALRIGNMIAVTISAVETYQTIHYFMNISENFSKSKYGEGSSSAINQVSNFFTQEVTAEYPDPETGEMNTVTGAPLQSENARVILGKVTPNLEKAEKYSLSRLSKTIQGTLALTGATMTTCNIASAANAAISLASLLIPGGGLVKLATSLLIDFAFNTGVALAVTGVLAFVVPTIARTLFENAFDSLTGIPAGEAFGKGAAAANTQVAARGSGQMGATADKLQAYQHQTNEVLALDAELDRKNLSPFDASNKNTFLGSIVHSAIGLATTSSAIAPLATLSNLTRASASNLLSPSTHAYGDIKYFDYYGDCPELESIGDVKGDMYCNRITSTDVSTEEISPDDETYIAVIEPNLEFDEETGQEKVKDDSRLAAFIEFCAYRESPMGIWDANIASAFETHFGILDNIPYIDDAVAMANAVEDELAEPWATGRICNDSPQNPDWDTEIKYYQRYVEDNRILNQFGAYKDEDSEDPVIAFLDRYEEKYPVDNTKEGLLARITGYSKDDIETMLAVIEYYNELEDYHPETAYAFDGETNGISNTFEGGCGGRCRALAAEPREDGSEERASENVITNTVYFSAYFKPQEVTA